MGAATRLEPATVAVPFPLCARAYRSAACPGGSSEPGNHRREGIDDVVLRLLDHVCRERAAGGAGHVRAERGHHRAGLVP